VPFLLVAGARERDAGSIAVRTRNGEDLGVLPLVEALSLLQDAIEPPDRDAQYVAQQQLRARLGVDTQAPLVGASHGENPHSRDL